MKYDLVDGDDEKKEIKISTSSNNSKLENHVDICPSSYAVNYSAKTLLIRSNVTTMNQVATIVSDSDKISDELFQDVLMAPMKSKMGNIFGKDVSKLDVFQYDYATKSGQGGDPDAALMKIGKAKKVSDDILECMSHRLSEYGGRIGTLCTPNSDGGGVGVVYGKMTLFQIFDRYSPQRSFGVTTLPIISDGAKYVNRQITLANALSRNFPNRELMYLQDNGVATPKRPRNEMDFIQAFGIEAVRNSKSISGNTDSTDRFGELKDNGNGVVMVAGMFAPLPLFKKNLIQKVINKDVVEDIVSETFTELSTQEGFDRWGNINARCVKPIYLGISGNIPKEIISNASFDRDKSTLDVLYLPTQKFFGDELFIFGIYTTDHSIDSIDSFFGLPLNGVRKVSNFNELVPKDILNKYAEKQFPRSKKGTDFMTVNRRIADICGVSEEHVLETI